MNPYLGPILADVRDGKSVPSFRVTWAACLSMANGDPAEGQRIMQVHYAAQFAEFRQSEWFPRPNLEVVK